jgi:hypothetical protein
MGLLWIPWFFGYGEHGQKPLALFLQMSQEGVKPNPVIFMESLNVPRCVEKQIIQSICESDVLMDDSLIDMCANLGVIRMFRVAK